MIAAMVHVGRRGLLGVGLGFVPVDDDGNPTGLPDPLPVPMNEIMTIGVLIALAGGLLGCVFIDHSDALS